MNYTTAPPKHEYQQKELNLLYAVCEVLVAIFAVIGNALVIFVFGKERRLRRRTNYYIVSLAAADFLVGLLGIPFALLASIGKPHNLHACLFTVSLLIVLCTISIFCLVAVSVDRYWAILYPMGYSRNVRTKTALVIISICWFAGIFVGFLPLLGWHKKPEGEFCFFLNVMQSNYLVFLYFGTIIVPALLLAAFYAHIYQVVLRQLKQMVIMHPEKDSSNKNKSSGGTMVRILGVHQTNEVKATQNLAIIVLFFMICWFPLYTINCIISFYPDFYVNSNVMLSSIILSHLNSVGNPLLYAYHLRDFRAAMKNFFLVLFNQHHRCEPIIRNYAQHNARLQKRSSSVSTCNLNNLQNRVHSKVKLIVPEKVSTIVQTSAVVAAATTGEVNRSIWNIAERSISSSSDSSKSLDSCNHDKTLIIRPATPYRPRNANELNTAYKMCYDDESDDGFNEEETLPYHDYILGDCEMETSSNKSISTPEKTRYCYIKSLSNSSPQLSRGLFFVEGGRENFKTVDFQQSERMRVVGVDVSPRKNNTFKLSTLHVINLFKGKKPLNRSLSDSGHVCSSSAKNGVLHSCAS